MSSIKDATVLDNLYDGPFRDFDQHVHVKVIEAMRIKQRFCIHFNRGEHCAKGVNCDYLHKCIICKSDNHGCSEYTDDDRLMCPAFTQIMDEHLMLSETFETLRAIHTAHAAGHHHHHKQKFVRQRFPTVVPTSGPAKSAWSSKTPAVHSAEGEDSAVSSFTEEARLSVPLSASMRLKASTSQFIVVGLPSGYTVSAWEEGAKDILVSTHGLASHSSDKPRKVSNIRIEM
jgi:hypothetical protein